MQHPPAPSPRPEAPRISLFAQSLYAALAARLEELSRPDRTPEEDAQLRRLQALLAGHGRTTSAEDAA